VTPPGAPGARDAALARAHSLPRRLTLGLKARLLGWRRRWRDLREGVRAHPPRPTPAGPHLLAERRSPLWGDAAALPPGERALTAGKIENLRVAARALHGARVPPLAPLSLWAQVGAPARRRGFVVGREVQQGCVVPTVAGGLCQLSNALYAAALDAGLEVVERHAHSLSPPGAQGRDATLKWPYLDLRLRAPFEWSVEARLEGDELVVRLWAAGEPLAAPAPPAPPAAPARPPLAAARSCYSCDVTACHQHGRHRAGREEAHAAAARPGARVALLLSGAWPEHEDALVARADELRGATLLTPAPAWLPRLGARYGWARLRAALRPAPGAARAVPLRALWRALALRLSARRGENAFAAQLREDARLARALSARLPYDATHLIVSQDLLPELERRGELAGRSLEVLQTRPPLRALHAQLDALALALAPAPPAPSLLDFRAPEEAVESEERALRAARRLYTPHPALAAAWGERGALLPWRRPAARPRPPAPPGGRRVVLFCGSLCARKGSAALSALWARERAGVLAGCELRVLRGQEDDPALRAALGARYFDPSREEEWGAVALALSLSPVPHAPRLALWAMARGVPVVAVGGGVSPLEVGDADCMNSLVKIIKHLYHNDETLSLATQR